MKPAPLSAFTEAISCATLGLRDGFSPRLILFSLGLWAGSLLLWAVILVAAWAKVKAVASFFCAWALLGLFVLFPKLLTASARAKLAGVPLSVGAEALLGRFFTGTAWVVLVLMILLLLLVTVRMAFEFALMPAVRAKVMERYASFPSHAADNIFEPLRNIAKMAFLAVAIGLPCLLIPVVNMALLFVLFGYLNVRSLINEALDGLATPIERRAVIRHGRWRMVLLGSLFGAVQTIPLIGFTSAAWIGAGTCHLCFRELLRLRAVEVQTRERLP